MLAFSKNILIEHFWMMHTHCMVIFCGCILSVYATILYIGSRGVLAGKEDKGVGWTMAVISKLIKNMHWVFHEHHVYKKLMCNPGQGHTSTDGHKFVVCDLQVSDQNKALTCLRSYCRKLTPGCGSMDLHSEVQKR